MSKEKKYYDNISVSKRTKQTAYFVAQHDKMSMLELVLNGCNDKQIIIITKSKKLADEVYFFLKDKNLKVFAIHGNHKKDVVDKMAQSFNDKELNILITTDMILQSLSLDGIEVVINYDLPFECENYFKGLKLVDEVGESVLFVSPDDEKLFATLELMIKMEIEEGVMDGFTPTPYVKKNTTKKKKPRHKKVKKVSKPIES